LATPEELAIVDRYTVNVALSGHGGSLESARKMMQAGAAIIQAGGAGVFIDNSGLTHGAESWLYMTEEGSSDAVRFAFVGIVRGQREVWTTGMHVPGFPEIMMKRAAIRYVYADNFAIGDGHIIADVEGPRFRIEHESPEELGVPESMRNPFGRLGMTSIKDIAERNGSPAGVKTVRLTKSQPLPHPKRRGVNKSPIYRSGSC
jgi:hypothetical protein